MKWKFLLLCFIGSIPAMAQMQPGAALSFTTIEAESMRTNAIVLKPRTDPHFVQTESSGRSAVELKSKDHFIEFIAPILSNSLVIRYSLPDNKTGTGLVSSLDIIVNGKNVKQIAISSICTWLYGKYPFSNLPDTGKPRHFYDEARIKDISIKPGDKVLIKRNIEATDTAGYCIIDLVDLEKIPPALKAPDNALSLTDPAFSKYVNADDYTDVFKQCIAKAAETNQPIWIPSGEYKITGDLILPANITIKGAGFWYAVLKGDQRLYTNANRRVRLKGKGSNIHLSDFSIDGALNYRSDKEDNDGIVGSFGENSSISNIWIEHTKVGIWVENGNGLHVSGCRLRNTIADGINFCTGMNNSIMENCSARGTGDDGFAIWPATFGKQQYKPGHNLITHCTAQLPFLANGAAIYGGESNAISNCLFTDITQGSGILISTTFPTENANRGINNNFSGITKVDSCVIRTSGGFDHEWGLRGSIEICIGKRTIDGLQISDVVIENSLSNAVSIVAKEGGVLQNAVLKNISTIGEKRFHGLFIAEKARGSIHLQNCTFSKIENNNKDFSVQQ